MSLVVFGSRKKIAAADQRGWAATATMDMHRRV
jgi:hypothetical protein